MKLFTSIGEIVNRYWQNHKPESSNLPMHIAYIEIMHSWHFEIVYKYWQKCILVLMKLYTRFNEIINLYWESILVTSILVYNFINTGYMISLIPPVYNFINTSIWFHQYQYMILSILVNDFFNNGQGTFSKIWVGLRSKLEILKVWGVLETYMDQE